MKGKGTEGKGKRPNINIYYNLDGDEALRFIKDFNRNKKYNSETPFIDFFSLLFKDRTAPEGSYMFSDFDNFILTKNKYKDEPTPDILIKTNNTELLKITDGTYPPIDGLLFPLSSDDGSVDRFPILGNVEIKSFS